MSKLARSKAGSVSRRALLAGMAGFTFIALPRLGFAQEPTNPVFRHGVASGDPDQHSIVLWTRVTTQGERQVWWQLAHDPSFSVIVQQGTTKAHEDSDHSVKILADGLEPGRTYYYRFIMADVVSPVGRTRTLPDGPLERLGIALASCSNYPFGFFNAYDAIARDADVQFILHTGDYIYEYGHDGWGDDVARTIGRRHEPAHEITSLNDYRLRHAQYKSDRGAQAMHGAHPLLACWDDHEVANDPWKDGAQNHQNGSEGEWNTRRAAAIRAYYEWMPVREPDWLAEKGRNRMQFWRCYRFGNLATLFTLETRHTARSRQIDYADYKEALLKPEGARHFIENVLGAPNRPIMASELEEDLTQALRDSVSEGQPWRLIGNPVPIARTHVPDLAKSGLLPENLDNLRYASTIREFAWLGASHLPITLDSWDGYGWARQRLYDLSREAGAADLVFLTGDSHSFWASQLVDDQGRSAGVELGTAGISSPGTFMALGFGPELARKFDTAIAEHNDEVLWTDNMHQGYVRLELTAQRGSVTYVAVNTILSTSYHAAPIKHFALKRETDGVTLA